MCPGDEHVWKINLIKPDKNKCKEWTWNTGDMSHEVITSETEDWKQYSASEQRKSHNHTQSHTAPRAPTAPTTFSSSFYNLLSSITILEAGVNQHLLQRSGGGGRTWRHTQTHTDTHRLSNTTFIVLLCSFILFFKALCPVLYELTSLLLRWLLSSYQKLPVAVSHPFCPSFLWRHLHYVLVVLLDTSL